MMKPPDLIRLLFLVTLLFLVGGCELLTQPRSDGYLPGWALSPPGDDSSKIYAVGEGGSLRAARDDALGMIAGKISTNVQAETKLEVKLVNGKESSAMNSNVRTSTEALKLSDYEILKTAQSSGKRFVLLALDRGNLTNTLVAKLETLDNTIVGRLAGPAGNQSLRRLYIINMLRGDLTKGLQLLSLIEGVSPGFSSQDYRKRYNSFLKERELLEHTVRVGVVADENTQGLKENITRLFLEQGIQAESYRSGQQYAGVAYIAGSAERAEIFDEMHVQLSVHLKLASSDGSVVSQAQLRAGASSLSSFGKARDSANRLLSQQVEEQGVWSAFNMQ